MPRQLSKRNSSNKLKIADRRRQAAALYKTGLNQQEIADKLGVNRATITRDIDFLHKQLISMSIDDVKTVRIKELAKLDAMEIECDRRLNLYKDSPKGALWMDNRLRVLERRAKLLGLDAANKHAVLNIHANVDKNEKDKLVEAALATMNVQISIPEPMPEIEHKPEDTIEAEFEELPEGMYAK